MKTKKLILYSFIFLVAFAVIAYYFLFVNERLKAPAWNLQTNSITIEGIERTFDYYVPENLSTSPSLVFLLHGSEGEPQVMRYLTNYEFEKEAKQRKNFILVYPQGFEKHWNDCRGSATYTANTMGINDIDFFKEMISFFVGNYTVDESSVFSIGYSNGGHMCFRLAFELPDLFRGIGIYCANIPEPANNECKPKNLPVSIIIINGTNDPINPFGGGLVVGINGDSSRGNVLSSHETYDYFKNLLPDICSNQKSVQIIYSDKVTGIETTCADSDDEVELIQVEGGGHTIPLVNKPPFLPAFVGSIETGINSPEIVLDFFEELK